MNYKFERVVSNDKQISKLYELLKLRKYLISHASLQIMKSILDL